jgi:hypothetical protein
MAYSPVVVGRGRPSPAMRRAAIMETLDRCGPLTKDQLVELTGMNINLINANIGYLNLWGEIRRALTDTWADGWEVMVPAEVSSRQGTLLDPS